MLTRARAAVLVVAVLALAACGNVHPGDAAVVDGRGISMQTLNKTAEAYCTLTLNSAQQQGVNAVSNTEMRRQAVTGLVSVVVARKLAKDEDIQIPANAYELTEAQRDQIAKVFPKADLEQITKVIEDNQEISAIAIALAEKTTGQKATSDNETQFAELGHAAIAKAFRANDVQFAPRFGLSPTGQARADTGSISVASVDLEAPAAEELPDTQRCS